MKAPLWERLRSAWDTFTDNEDAALVLTGPLPLWMQQVFEEQAKALGVPVGHVIYRVLERSARRVVTGTPDREITVQEDVS